MEEPKLSSEISAKIEWIKTRLGELIESFSAKKSYNRRRALIFYLTITILGATTTIILGLNIENLKELFRIIALCSAGIITILNAYNAFFNYKGLYVKYNNTKNKLTGIRDDLEYYTTGNNNISIDELEKYKVRLDNILNDINEDWTSLTKNTE